MEKDHPYYETIVNDPRYAGDPKPEEFPMFESLKLTIERTLPYWNDVIVPQVKQMLHLAKICCLCSSSDHLYIMPLSSSSYQLNNVLCWS